MRYVYFVKEVMGLHAPIKIGVARDVSRRFEALQIGNPRQLEVIAKIGPMPTAQAYHTEKTLHNRFRQFHIRGEWFSGVILQHLHTLREPIECADQETQNLVDSGRQERVRRVMESLSK